MLRDLYYGKIIPCERKNRLIEEQHEIVKRIANEEIYFANKLSQEDCERFQKLSGLYSELFETEEVEVFTYGISMGVLLMRDIMDEANAMKFK